MENNNDSMWWKHGVVYHIYPRSFCDSNNDGNGDLKGIISKLPYLSNLGIDAIWLSPIYDSPMLDNGYDVRDYRKINIIFGNMDDFKELLHQAHSMNIRIIMDMILNHTSDQHPWFIESRSSVNSPKRDWYLWKKGRKNRFTPNNWRSAFGGSAWEYDKASGHYYMHTFLKEQPDLNWRNKELRKQIYKEMKLWLDMGVDGFRLDVINMIVKDKKYRNNPSFIKLLFPKNKILSRNRPKSYKIVRKLRQIVNQYPEKALIGEIYNTPPGDSQLVASYLGNGTDSLNMAFDFSLFFKGWSAKKYYDSISSVYSELPEKGWPCFVFSNHDLSRSISRFKSYSNEKALLAAVLLLTLRGTPFIYYGEELGMKSIKLRKSQINDPLGKKLWPFYKGRDSSRSPMQWDNTRYAGFSETEPWLPLSPDHETDNVKTESENSRSILNNYISLIKLRKKYPSLSKGEWEPFVKGENNIIAYHRVYDNERVTVAINFSSKPSSFKLRYKQYRFLYTTHPETLSRLTSTTLLLMPFQAIILQVLGIDIKSTEDHKVTLKI